MFSRLIRPSTRTLGSTSTLLRRSFYSKRAKFVTLDAQGDPSEREVDIRVGDEHEAWVIVPTDVGNAIKEACWQKGSPRTDWESLTWHHDGRYFTCGSAPYPRLSIAHDLRRQSPAQTSPATLLLFEASHSITLDGTPDSWFMKQAQKSCHELKPVLDNLKDM